jgi:hypothetical protein
MTAPSPSSSDLPPKKKPSRLPQVTFLSAIGEDVPQGAGRMDKWLRGVAGVDMFIQKLAGFCDEKMKGLEQYIFLYLIENPYSASFLVEHLTYGVEHVHGILLDGEEIAGFERDNLHREIERTLRNGLTLTHTRYFDPAGRLDRETE